MCQVLGKVGFGMGVAVKVNGAKFPISDTMFAYLLTQESQQMTPEQRIVAVGAASGVVGMAVAVWALTEAMPAPLIVDSPAERVAYALRSNVLALVPLFVMLMAVGNA